MSERVYYNKLSKKQDHFCIIVEYGLRKEIMYHFNTTYPTVKSALEYKTNTLLAQKIRQYALTKGGILAKRVKV